MTDHHRSAEYAAFARMARPLIRASLPQPCVDCGFAVFPDQRWDIGHIIAHSMGGPDELWNTGASHVKCNRSSGQRMSVAVKKKNKHMKSEKSRW